MMLSVLPPFEDPFSPFAGGGFPPWDEDFPKPVTSSSGSDEPKRSQEKSEPERRAEERKRRRMISNRESARRSRMRKQRHLENLRNQLNKCRVENRELNSRLQFAVHHCNRVRAENEWLRSERALLRQKVANFTQILIFQQLQPSLSMDMQYLPHHINGPTSLIN